MPHWTSLAPTVLASFMASMVEFVEALTIVLAVGLVRGWRSALLGTGAALAVLSALVAVLGPSLARIPVAPVQLVVGTLLLMFGLRWLRKAVLRAAGVLALHDEAKAFAQESEMLRSAGSAVGAIDKVAFGSSFKIVMLEGIEVVFIVIAIGAGGPLLLPASIGAGLALLVVAGLGLVVHRPLAKVPENSLKFGVGVLLSAFGSFWVGEGVNLEWPAGDWALLGLIVLYLAVALVLVSICRQMYRRREYPRPMATVSGDGAPSFGAIGVILAELWSLFVDDIWLAAGVLILVVGAWATKSSMTVLWVPMVFTIGLNVVLALSAVRRARA